MFLALVVLAFAAAPESIRGAAPSAVTDVNPDGLPSAPYGGRVRGITISPVNNQFAYAASEALRMASMPPASACVQPNRCRS